MNKQLKVLMVGNSFSLSCRRYLPGVAASVPGCDLKLEIAYIGGCSLERHIHEYEEALNNPEHRPYSDFLNQPANLPEFLSRDRWDIISIQQASHFSWDYSTYQPWAEKLIAIIRETNPQAEIIVQQTWSYNAGDARIHDLSSGWEIGQDGMFQRLNNAYHTLAAHYDFRLVPVGQAVQFSRETNPPQLPLDKEAYAQELLQKFTPPEPLPIPEDAVGNIRWTAENGISIDTIHLSLYGEYLQACVWFAFLFQRPVGDIAFYPPELPDRQRLDRMRSCAQRAIDTL